MEFNYEELRIIEKGLEKRQMELSKDLKQWRSLEWENLGNLQNMYANKESFEVQKNDLIENWETEYNKIQEILDKIYDYI